MQHLAFPFGIHESIKIIYKKFQEFHVSVNLFHKTIQQFLMATRIYILSFIMIGQSDCDLSRQTRFFEKTHFYKKSQKFIFDPIAKIPKDMYSGSQNLLTTVI